MSEPLCCRLTLTWSHSKKELEFKSLIHELEEVSTPYPLVTEPGSNSQLGFEFDEARPLPPLETAGVAVIANVARMLDEAKLLPPELAGLVTIAYPVMRRLEVGEFASAMPPDFKSNF